MGKLKNLNELYMVYTSANVTMSEDTIGSYTTNSKSKVSDCLNSINENYTCRVFELPSWKEITKADITLS